MNINWKSGVIALYCGAVCFDFTQFVILEKLFILYSTWHISGAKGLNNLAALSWKNQRIKAC